VPHAHVHNCIQIGHSVNAFLEEAKLIECNFIKMTRKGKQFMKFMNFMQFYAVYAICAIYKYIKLGLANILRRD
jgi:hypothetical protein